MKPFARIILVSSLALALAGCNTSGRTTSPQARGGGDIVRAAFIMTEDPARCSCASDGEKVTREGFRAAVARLAQMPPGKGLDLLVRTDYLCWHDSYPCDYERELAVLAALTNFTSLSLAVHDVHHKLDLSALAGLPLTHLTIDNSLHMPSVSGLETSSVEHLTLIGCSGVNGFCDLPHLKRCECQLDALGLYEIPAADIRSRFPSVERVFGNGVYPPDLPPCLATNGITSLRYREWGALNGPDQRYAIDFARQRVSVEVYDHSVRAHQEPCILKGERLSRRDDWEKILACLEEVDICGWKDAYTDPGICDGTLWRLELLRGTNVVKRIDGDNAAPPAFRKFCTVKQVVFDKFGGCSLWYPELRDEWKALIEAAEARARQGDPK